MVEAIRLEGLVLEAIAKVSRDNWVPLSTPSLINRIDESNNRSGGTSSIELVETVIALESRELVQIRKFQGSSPILVPYNPTESRQETYKSAYFGRGTFELRLTHEGRKMLDEIQEGVTDSRTPACKPVQRTAADSYDFHPEIERVSGQLYRDGHYKQAALEAYIRVVEEVKSKSGLPDEGDSLMNRAFGCDKQVPVVQFNTLRTGAERDEQKGLMFLFKGIVGLRNSKAHSNRLFNDPSRANDYLALASLLMRLLEIATVNRTR